MSINSKHAVSVKEYMTVSFTSYLFFIRGECEYLSFLGFSAWYLRTVSPSMKAPLVWVMRLAGRSVVIGQSLSLTFILTEAQTSRPERIVLRFWDVIVTCTSLHYKHDGTTHKLKVERNCLFYLVFCSFINLKYWFRARWGHWSCDAWWEKSRTLLTKVLHGNLQDHIKHIFRHITMLLVYEKPTTQALACVSNRRQAFLFYGYIYVHVVSAECVLCEDIFARSSFCETDYKHVEVREVSSEKGSGYGCLCRTPARSNT